MALSGGARCDAGAVLFQNRNPPNQLVSIRNHHPRGRRCTAEPDIGSSPERAAQSQRYCLPDCWSCCTFAIGMETLFPAPYMRLLFLLGIGVSLVACEGDVGS